MRKCFLLAALLCLINALCVASPLPRLKVSANKRFLVTEHDRPFFWLGDTAWNLFVNLDTQEANRYLRDRRAKRFTVIQVSLLGEHAHAANIYGHQPFRDKDFAQPNEAYWRHVDRIVDRAGTFGLYMALLPAWARTYVEERAGSPREGRLETPATAYAYGRFLGARYRTRPHIIWILGGDVRPTKDAIYDALAKGVADGAARGNQDQILMSYHPPGGTFRPPATSTGEFYHMRTWLDFNMIQSGHRIGNKSYERIVEDYRRTPIKPTFDSEPCYEAHPVEHKFEKGVFRAWHVRQRAYWSLLAGAFGFTYGGNGVFQMDKPGRIFLTSHHNRFWYDALNLEGAGQMRHVRALIESRLSLAPERVPDQSILASPEGTVDDRVQAARAADNGYWMLYVTSGQTIKVRMDKVSGARARAWWYNPRDGRVYTAHNRQARRPFMILETKGEQEFNPPGEPGVDNDWILVLDDARRRYPVPGVADH